MRQRIEASVYALVPAAVFKRTPAPKLLRRADDFSLAPDLPLAGAAGEIVRRPQSGATQTVRASLVRDDRIRPTSLRDRRAILMSFEG
jgi:hypothetical protein